MRAVPLPSDRFRMWDGNFRSSQSALCTYSVRGGVRCGVRCGAVVVVVGHKIPKLKVAAAMARPVRFGCCGAHSELSFYHIVTFKLVRSGEIKPPDCLCAISGSAPSQRGAFWWKFRLILGPLNRPLEHHWHSWNRKICDFKKLDFFMIYTCDEI